MARKPMAAMYSRSSSATRKKKLTTCSGVPANLARSSGSCAAPVRRPVVSGAPASEPEPLHMTP